MNEKITKLMKRCGLGEVTAEITHVSGGLMHRMYKVRTDSGIYAVKRLNPEIMKRPTARENYAAAEALEARLEEARVPMVAALTLKGRKMQELDGEFFYIFRWQKGRITDANTVTAEQCRKAGELLGRIHAIDSRAAEPDAPELSTIDFAGYARMAQEAGSPVAELLAKNTKLLTEAQQRLNEAREALPAIVSICDDDMDPKNVMWFRGKPFVIDLECLAYGNPVGAFVDLALQWAGMVNGAYRRENLEAFYEGYRSAYDNGFLAYDALYGIAYTWVEWLTYNIRRALGLEGSGEDERQLGEREVRNTVARIKALGDAEEEICGTLRELRVREMEGVFDRATALLKEIGKFGAKAKKTRAAGKLRQELRTAIDALEAYYESPLWKADFAANEDGRFPAGMKRGVLSEDGVYDLLEQYGELA
ncbi:MAG: DUF4298 domain-containing protein [Lachnospiraceae bacterium]|nr:DUF4298 domain-containing protein [Lachnospiraceae bacterium]